MTETHDENNGLCSLGTYLFYLAPFFSAVQDKNTRRKEIISHLKWPIIFSLYKANK